VTVNTPEILIPVDDAEKFEVMANIVSNADFPTGKINTLDGLRVDFTDGWGLVRASNTSAALTARFEATTEENLATIMQAFSTQISRAEPDIKLPF
jgi:phosphomannomutase/phosphoglucomutase